MTNRANRGPALTAFAVLFALNASRNLVRLFFESERFRFVFFGQQFSGAVNAVLGAVFGLYLAVLAYGIWHMRRFALPMSHAYALYVFANLTAFWLTHPERASSPFALAYAAVALGTTLGAAALLTRRKAELA